jgi:hypothetical protein
MDKHAMQSQQEIESSSSEDFDSEGEFSDEEQILTRLQLAPYTGEPEVCTLFTFYIILTVQDKKIHSFTAYYCVFISLDKCKLHKLCLYYKVLCTCVYNIMEM